MDGTVRTGSNWDPTEYGMFPFFRDLLLSAVLALPCVPICKAQIDSGVDINEKQVAAFLHDVKTLEVKWSPWRSQERVDFICGERDAG